MKRHILIIGAGYSGLSGALSVDKCLKDQGCSDIFVTVLAPLPIANSAPYRDVLSSRKIDTLFNELIDSPRIKHVDGIVNKIDVYSRKVIYTASQGIKSWISYDKLILASGRHVVRPNLEGVEHAFDISPIDTSACMEKHFAALFGYPDSEARNTLVICGGGVAGLESAKQITARMRSSLGTEVKINVVVIDCDAQIGARNDGSNNPMLARALAGQNIKWHFNAKVASLDTNGIDLVDGQRIESKTVVWTAGHRASHLTEHIDSERDTFGRLHVDPNLRVSSQQHVYAVGDVAVLSAADHSYYPTLSCDVSCRMGGIVGLNVVADLTGEPLKAYTMT